MTQAGEFDKDQQNFTMFESNSEIGGVLKSLRRIEIREDKNYQQI